MTNGTDPDAQAKLFVLQLLAGHPVTRETIEQSIDDVLPMLRGRHPDHVFNQERLVRELEAELNVIQADSVSLDDPAGHIEWLPLRREEIDWRFYLRYLRYLREQERLPPAVLDRLDISTERILRKLEDPLRAGPFDRRGMVVGQIQSGKTGSYTGLVSRAADAGYRLIVVAAGMHNNLRSQTQLRLDAGFVGMDTQRRQLADSDAAFASAALGVGRLVGAPRLDVASLTTSAENGDFGVARANSLGLLIGSFPVLLVVKKHRGILDNLRQWVLTTHGTGDPPLVRNTPLLFIDDEADNASINTLDPTDQTGEYSADLDPSRVNGGIRLLLNAFEKKAYVGYTATPFANIYIADDWEHPEYGPELFPRSFIEYLRPPSNYFGPARLLGIDGAEPLPLYRRVTDHGSWVPDRHRVDHRVGAAPDTLGGAIRSFVLSRAARLARGQTTAHNSMLVHVTRFTAVQAQVRQQVETELENLRSRIRFGDGGGPSVRAELRTLWESDFIPTSQQFDSDGVPVHSWEEIEPHLEDAVVPIVVKTINGTAQDSLEYFENGATGLNVIAVGGAKLSRGLTLEGLTVSYYLRTTQAADTLLQMGRWFGYRQGYEDLCRLWTTPALWQSYREVTNANEELIREFEEMASRGLTPEQYGLKVQNSMAGMMVTAANKMRSGTRLRVGFSGAISETVVLHCDRTTADANRTTTDAFVAMLGNDHGEPSVVRGDLVWRGIPGQEVADLFFADFRTPEQAWRVHAGTIAEYIRGRVAVGELVDWTVVLVSVTGQGRQPAMIGGRAVGLTHREVLEELEDRVRSGFYSIRRILNPPDEWIDFSADEQAAALARSIDEWHNNPGRRASEPDRPSGWVVRRMRPVTNGLLILYPLEPPREELRGDDTTDGAMIGFAVSFPHSPDAPAVDYVVNRRFLEELLGDPDT